VFFKSIENFVKKLAMLLGLPILKKTKLVAAEHIKGQFPVVVLIS